jgi:hypothetical protein
LVVQSPFTIPYMFLNMYISQSLFSHLLCRTPTLPTPGASCGQLPAWHPDIIKTLKQPYTLPSTHPFVLTPTPRSILPTYPRTGHPVNIDDYMRGYLNKVSNRFQFLFFMVIQYAATCCNKPKYIFLRFSLQEVVLKGGPQCSQIPVALCRATLLLGME